MATQKKEPEKKEAEEEAAEGEVQEKPKGRFTNKHIILFGLLPVLLLISIGTGLFLSGAFKSAPKPEEAAASADGHSGKSGQEGPVFYDLGEILVNLSSDSRRQNFLKLKVSLELEDAKDKVPLDVIKPRIVDNFQVYLRELRIDDLRGSAGIYRLREELLTRVTEAAHPIRIKDVLFQEMLVQ